MSTDTPPNKAARTERLTISSDALSPAHFIGTKSGASQSAYDALTGPIHANPPLAGYGQRLSWCYTPGTAALAVWDNRGGEVLANFTHAPIFPHRGGDAGVSRDPVAYICESCPSSVPHDATLAFCSTRGVVKTSDNKTKFQFSYNEADGYLKVSSFAVAPRSCPISQSKPLREREHFIAGSTNGVLVCVSSPSGSAPNVNEEDLEEVYLDLTLPLTTNAVPTDTHSASSANTSVISGWLSWLPTPGRGGANHVASHVTPSPTLSADAKAAFQYAHFIEDKAIRHVTPVPYTGVVFAIGNDAIALAVKSENVVDPSYEGPDRGMTLAWAVPVSNVSHKRLHIVSIFATIARVYVLATYRNDSNRGGILFSLRFDNGGIVHQVPVHLPTLNRGDDATRGTTTVPAATLLIESDSHGMSDEAAVVVFGNTITRISLGVSVHSPCRSEDVQQVPDVILAANFIGQRLFLLTPEGPLAADEAKDLLDIRAKQALASLLVTLNTDDRVTADAAVLAHTEALILNFPYHSSNWARASLDGCYAEHPREDRNIFTYINGQVINRQEKHRHMVRNVLGCPDVVSKLSFDTIAKLISDQEKLSALRCLRDLQNAAATDNIQREVQHVLRQCILSVSEANKASKSRIPSHVTDAEINSATPGEVFYGHQDNVVSLLATCNRRLAELMEAPNVHVSALVNCAIATAHIFVRVFEAIHASRHTDIDTPTASTVIGQLWTNTSCDPETTTASHVCLQAQLLSDVLAHAVSTGLPLNQNATPIGSNSFRSVALTVAGDTTGQCCDVVSQQAQGHLLRLIISLLSEAVEFHSREFSADGDMVQFGPPVRRDAVQLVESCFLRTPFLQSKDGVLPRYGYPHGAPIPNPGSPICVDVVASVERLAMDYKLFDLLFAFSLSDPTRIDQFKASAAKEAGPKEDPRLFYPRAAQEFYKRYQYYCCEVSDFYLASLHHVGCPTNYRVAELELLPLLSGIPSPQFVVAARDRFLRIHAPNLVWLISPHAVGEAVSGDAALGILKGGSGPVKSAVFQDDASEAEHFDVAAAMAKMALLAFGTPAEDDGSVHGTRNPSPEPGVGTVACETSAAPPVLLTNHDSCQQAFAEVLLATRVSVAQSTFFPGIQSAPCPIELVRALTALESVDAWCAAASLCDALANIHELLLPLPHTSVSGMRLTKGPIPTIQDLVQHILSRAVHFDGENRVSELASVDEQQLFTREVFMTAQGRVVLSCALLSGVGVSLYRGALDSLLRGTVNSPLCPIANSNADAITSSSLFASVYGNKPEEDATGYSSFTPVVIGKWLNTLLSIATNGQHNHHSAGSAFGSLTCAHSTFAGAANLAERSSQSASDFLRALLPHEVFEGVIRATGTTSHGQGTDDVIQSYLNGAAVLVAPQLRQL